jgi:hypothetical protein
LAFLRTCQDGENALRPTFLPKKQGKKVGRSDFIALNFIIVG